MASTCAWQGSTITAGASPGTEPPACEGTEVTLPSGAILCEGAPAPAATTAAAPSILLKKTVGTDPKTCATTTGITVSTANNRVIYCYSVENTGDVAFGTHDLEDDKLGTLLSDLAFDLQPGGKTFATAAATLPTTPQTVVNTATWTASNGVDQAQSSAQATVTLEAGASAPSPVTAAPEEGEASITWGLPASSGGYPITGYRITVQRDGSPVSTTDVATTPRSRTFTGLANGSDYRFDVQAITEIGAGATASSPTVSVDWWLPWSSASKAGTEIYTWFTGRAPTSSQLSAFIAAGNGGSLPGTQIDALRDGADATTNVDPVVRLYSAYFLRPPDRSGFDFWVNRRRSGAWTISRISASFADSSEFENRYGSLSNSAFVTLVYDNVLGRAPEADGLAYWTRQLDQGRRSRGQVMANFSESSEYKRKSALPVDAVSIAIQLLGTSPSKARIDTLVAEIEDSSLPQLVRRLVHEPSFDTRAG
jgi:hypothetical protein